MFQERLKEKIGPKGYEPGMRRSVQSAIMFEAQRCVQDRLDSMRPFQRKIAFFDQMVALLETLDYIAPHHRAEIMCRTATSKEPMTPESKSQCVPVLYQFWTKAFRFSIVLILIHSSFFVDLF